MQERETKGPQSWKGQQGMEKVGEGPEENEEQSSTVKEFMRTHCGWMVLDQFKNKQQPRGWKNGEYILLNRTCHL